MKYLLILFILFASLNCNKILEPGYICFKNLECPKKYECRIDSANMVTRTCQPCNHPPFISITNGGVMSLDTALDSEGNVWEYNYIRGCWIKQ